MAMMIQRSAARRPVRGADRQASVGEPSVREGVVRRLPVRDASRDLPLQDVRQGERVSQRAGAVRHGERVAQRGVAPRSLSHDRVTADRHRVGAGNGRTAGARRAGNPAAPGRTERPIGVRGCSAGTACAVRPAARPARVLIVVALLTAAVVVLLTLLGEFSASGGVPERTAVVQVQPGDTLSGIAARSAPDADHSAMMARIEQLNGLTSVSLDVGQPLVVPVSGR